MRTQITSVVGLCILLLTGSLVSCSKKVSSNNGGSGNSGGTGGDTTTIKQPVDPSVAATQGFFLTNGWKARSFTLSDSVAGTAPAASSITDQMTVDVSNVLTKVSPYVFGNNSNMWTGTYPTQPTLIQYLKDLSPNIIRGPGGSTSDIFFWNDTVTPPTDAPAQLYSNGSLAAAGYWFGDNSASWTNSVDDYYQTLTATGSTGLLTINYGYARYGTGPNPVASAAHLAADWVRYDNGRTKYWEIGNENYGNWEAGYQIDVSANQDGQPEFMLGSLYAQHFQVFADSMRAAAQEIGATIYIGAFLEDSPPYQGAYTTLETWNQGVLSGIGSTADFFVIHDYFTAYNTNSTVSQILSTATTVPAGAMTYLQQQFTQYGATPRPIAFDEWNIQAVGSGQQTSYIAGIHAVMALGAIIQNHFGQASRWDIANSYDNGDDQGMFSYGGEPGVPLYNPRPSFYYLYYFQKCFGDRMVYDSLASYNADLTAYASTFSSGQMGAVIANSSATNSHTVGITVKNFIPGVRYFWFVLTGGSGTFSNDVSVNGNGPTNSAGGPTNYGSLAAYYAPISEGQMIVTVPPLGVAYLVAEGQE